jgi:hypothetical protein
MQDEVTDRIGRGIRPPGQTVFTRQAHAFFDAGHGLSDDARLELGFDQGDQGVIHAGVGIYFLQGPGVYSLMPAHSAMQALE